mmetsp:Transcript_11278/g.11309  ORF Transcript_11278/g.11309 Transcript_11278/m.11309 type:complete len:323 (+) Transcript_11278:64-1032(+)
MKAKPDTPGFSGKPGDKFTLQEVGSHIFQASLEKLGSFKDLIMARDFGGMLKLLKSGDPVAIAIIFWTCVSAALLYYLLSSMSESEKDDTKDSKQEEEEPIVLRDFTLEQLRQYDGVKNKSLYIAIKGEVYDVSKSPDMYGPQGAYYCFTGRDATRALARLSFEEEDLSNPNIEDLGPFERDTLEQWIEKFRHYRGYPVVGRVSEVPKEWADRTFSRSDLTVFDGSQSVPSGRVDAPILLGVSGRVLDVSYGGKEHYGPGGGYHLFAGKDASRALAKMSFSDEDVSSHDLSDLDETQLKTLADWERRFIEVKLYPVVGRLVD